MFEKLKYINGSIFAILFPTYLFAPYMHKKSANLSFFHALLLMLLTKFVLNKTKKVHFLHHCRKLAHFFVRLHLPFVHFCAY